jgi:hypothetical protein
VFFIPLQRYPFNIVDDHVYAIPRSDGECAGSDRALVAVPVFGSSTVILPESRGSLRIRSSILLLSVVLAMLCCHLCRCVAEYRRVPHILTMSSQLVERSFGRIATALQPLIDTSRSKVFPPSV